MDSCKVAGCTKTVNKAGFSFCFDHWKAEKAGRVTPCPRCGKWIEGRDCPACAGASATVSDDAEDSPAGLLTSTKLGKEFNLSNVKINLILQELGWIEKYVRGWIPTDRGNALGANVKEMRNGTPYVVWPPSILDNDALLDSIDEQTGTKRPTKNVGSASADQNPPRSAKADPTSNPPKSDNFRDKFPATLRTQDGHMVRSRAEVLIDNWLYMQGKVHAYERKLPIEEEAYCDFYLPVGKGVYIEYWGLESDPRFADQYKARKQTKQALYAKYKLQLIELEDKDIERLDDELPRRLLKFGIESV